MNLNGNALYEEEESLPEKLQFQSAVNGTNINFDQNSFRSVSTSSCMIAFVTSSCGSSKSLISFIFSIG